MSGCQPLVAALLLITISSSLANAKPKLDKNNLGHRIACASQAQAMTYYMPKVEAVGSLKDGELELAKQVAIQLSVHAVNLGKERNFAAEIVMEHIRSGAQQQLTFMESEEQRISDKFGFKSGVVTTYNSTLSTVNGCISDFGSSDNE